MRIRGKNALGYQVHHGRFYLNPMCEIFFFGYDEHARCHHHPASPSLS